MPWRHGPHIGGLFVSPSAVCDPSAQHEAFVKRLAARKINPPTIPRPSRAAGEFVIWIDGGGRTEECSTLQEKHLHCIHAMQRVDRRPRVCGRAKTCAVDLGSRLRGTEHDYNHPVPEGFVIRRYSTGPGVPDSRASTLPYPEPFWP